MINVEGWLYILAAPATVFVLSALGGWLLDKSMYLHGPFRFAVGYTVLTTFSIGGFFFCLWLIYTGGRILSQ